MPGADFADEAFTENAELESGLGRRHCDGFVGMVAERGTARVVAGQCFATAMEPNDPKGPVDIRAHGERVTHTATQLPSEIADGVRAMMNQLGLVFGAFDFIVRLDGHWVFLELNPNGQWAWTEHAAGLPISTALADLLEKGSLG